MEPRTASDDSFASGRRPRRIRSRGNGVVALIVPILAPLPHVSVGVMQLERVRLEAADGGRVGVMVFDGAQERTDLDGGMGLFQGGIRAVCCPLQIVGRIPSIRTRRCSRAACVFPFGFGWQTVSTGPRRAQPIAKRCGVVPIDVNHRMVVALMKAGCPPSPFRPLRPQSVGAIDSHASRAVSLCSRFVLRGLDESAELT